MKRKKSNIAVIGGSGFDPREFLKDIKSEEVKTPYGAVIVHEGTWKDRRVLAINRHRDGTPVPAHEVNYRANMLALWFKGADSIISTGATGGVSSVMSPGDFVFVDQYVNWGTPVVTYFEGKNGVHYYDMTDPFCDSLRSILDHQAKEKNLSYHVGGIYVCTSGPPFETRAEIITFRKLDYDVVGMTIPMEAKLARELGMCYQPACIVTNLGAGRSDQKLTPKEVYAMMEKMGNKIGRLVLDSIVMAGLQKKRQCRCWEAQGPTENLIKSIAN